MSAAYLGTLGRLVGFENATAVGVSTGRPVSYDQTLEGRIKAQYGPRTRRSWSVEVRQAKPAQAGALLNLIEAGKPPFVWVEPYAQVTNLLTPEVSTCGPAAINATTNAVAGPMQTPDGWSQRSITNSDVSQLMRFGATATPVVPGIRVTASLYVLGDGAAARLYFYDAADRLIEYHTSTVTGSAGTVRRSRITATAPANAVGARILGYRVLQGANPAITWTADLAEWSVGRGCDSVMIDGFSETVHMASAEIPGWRRSTITFNVKELG